VKKKLNKETIAVLAVILMGIVISIIVLSLQKYGVLVFTSIPLVFIYPIYLCLSIPKSHDDDSSVILFVCLISRLLLVMCSLIIPVVIWNLVPSIKESTSILWVIFSSLLDAFVYIIFITSDYIKNKRVSKKNDKERQD